MNKNTLLQIRPLFKQINIPGHLSRSNWYPPVPNVIFPHVYTTTFWHAFATFLTNSFFFKLRKFRAVSAPKSIDVKFGNKPNQSG